MVTMHLIIRKHTFTESIDFSYFGNYGKLLELSPPPTDNFSELLYKFFVQVETFKPAVLAATGGPATGNTLTFITSHESPLTGYTFIGVVDMNNYVDNYIGLSQYPDFKAATEDLYADIGWTISDERCVNFQSQFDAKTVTFSNVPKTFAEIENYYNTGMLLQEYLDSL